ncbi:MAG TPA: hypothetical protein VF518_13935, partial [Polyangia bacterium]
SAEGSHMDVTLTGTADLTVKGQLDRFLRSLHAEARRRALVEVGVDVRRLEFMNSSCLKSFVWWIGTVQEQAPEDRYRIVFQSSSTVYWQRRSLNALACLASDIIRVQT